MNPVVTIIDYGPNAVLSATPAAVITNVKDVMHLPINCVVAGQQPQEKNMPRFVTDPYGILKKIIFGE